MTTDSSEFSDHGMPLRAAPTRREDPIEQLLAAVPTRLCTVEARRPFRNEGADRDRLYFVRSGVLAKYRLDTGARRHIVALRFRGEVVLPGDRAAAYGLLAIVNSELLVADRADVYAAIEAEPRFQTLVWHLLERESAIRNEWLVNCGRRDATERVAHLLCEMALRLTSDPEPDAIASPFTQQHIAEMTGQTSVNVNRVFADLERRGLIGRRGRLMTFDDWKGLKRLAGFDPAYLD